MSVDRVVEDHERSDQVCALADGQKVVMLPAPYLRGLKNQQVEREKVEYNTVGCHAIFMSFLVLILLSQKYVRPVPEEDHLRDHGYSNDKNTDLPPIIKVPIDHDLHSFQTKERDFVSFGGC